MEFTSIGLGDAPMLPELLDQIPPEQEIVTSPKTAPTIRARAMMPSRIVATQPSSHLARTQSPWKPYTLGAAARNEALRASQYLGRARFGEIGVAIAAEVASRYELSQKTIRGGVCSAIGYIA